MKRATNVPPGATHGVWDARLMWVLLVGAGVVEELEAEVAACSGGAGPAMAVTRRVTTRATAAAFSVWVLTTTRTAPHRRSQRRPSATRAAPRPWPWWPGCTARRWRK